MATINRQRAVSWISGPRLGGALLFLHGMLFAATAMSLPTSWHSADTEGLLLALREGGLVVYVRHAEAETEDDATVRLTEAGCQQLSATAAALADAGIDAETVLSSPTTRTRQSAQLLFPDADMQLEETLDMADFGDPETRDAAVAALRQLLATPTDGGNRWLIGHITPLVMTMETPFGGNELPVGTLAVFLPEEDGQFTHLGNLPPHWGLAEAEPDISCDGASPSE